MQYSIIILTFFTGIALAVPSSGPQSRYSHEQSPEVHNKYTANCCDDKDYHQAEECCKDFNQAYAGGSANKDHRKSDDYYQKFAKDDRSAFEYGFGFDKGVKYDKGYGYSKGNDNSYERADVKDYRENKDDNHIEYPNLATADKSYKKDELTNNAKFSENFENEQYLGRDNKIHKENVGNNPGHGGNPSYGGHSYNYDS